MCGITGYLAPSYQMHSDEFQNILTCMTNALHHRGPDSSGTWIDPTVGLGLGHRRLAIVDLSAEGHQPMLSHDSRYVIVFNGEIYNFTDLSRHLREMGHQFRGHSDTEVLLAAICQWGVPGALQRSVGMFAFALWDQHERTLYLGRDRLGEKPLYYGWCANVFLFASELKALCQYPAWQGSINRDALTLFLRHNYIPTPYTIYHNIWKLPPGTLLTVPTDRLTPHTPLEPTVYWSAQAIAERGSATPSNASDAEAIAHLDHVLREAVRLQMVADVPLGAFLSGGVDSSTIVALMQAQSTQPVRTFSIGFHEASYNEADHAKAVAHHLGTDHTDLYVTPEETMAVIPRLPTLYDEPFADSSQIPTFLVAQLARQHVTVSLSGDGGDEIFGGYNRYPMILSLWQKLGWAPPDYRYALARLIRTLPLDILTQQSKYTHLLATYSRKVQRLADLLELPHYDALYRLFLSFQENPLAVVLDGRELPTLFTQYADSLHLNDLTLRMMFLDLVTYLPDDILVKVDRAAMGVSLESRIPLLDHRVVEYAWSLPISMKVRNGERKWILRQVVDRYVPRALIERPKTGFGVPIGLWLRGPLHEWADALLHQDRLHREGFFDPHRVRQIWNEHCTETTNNESALWGILMFQAWLESVRK